MNQFLNVVKVNQLDNYLLASPSNIKLDRWQKSLNGYAHILNVVDMASLKDSVARLKPDVLLLDQELPGLGGVSGITGLRKLSPKTKIIMLVDSISDDEQEWCYFRAGVRGCCRNDINAETLRTLTNAVQQGELWIRRTLTYKLLDQMGEPSSKKKETSRKCLGQLAQLTRREYEISLRVSNGESNKQIAQSLDITERTVKAHLTEVYRKLGVLDRVKLAIVLSADSRQNRRPPTKFVGASLH